MYCHLVGYSSICGTKDLGPFAQQVLVAIFLHFNLKQKPLFTNNVGHTYLHIYFPFRKLFLEKILCIKKCNSEPFCFLIKVCYWKGNISKTLLVGSMLSLLTVFLSIPPNKLPLFLFSDETTEASALISKCPEESPTEKPELDEVNVCVQYPDDQNWFDECFQEPKFCK